MAWSQTPLHRAELVAGNSATEIVSILLAPFRELHVGREIAERAGRLRRESGIRLPDALIAATALEQKLSLFTRNRSDFEEVRGLGVREITADLMPRARDLGAVVEGLPPGVGDWRHVGGPLV